MKKPSKRFIIDEILDRSSSYSIPWLRRQTLNKLVYLLNQMLAVKNKSLCTVCEREITKKGQICLKCQFKDFRYSENGEKRMES